MAELTDARLAELREAFAACDPNSDGFIDRDEFHALLY
jgi:Ca2+-binding EF-hand superfamily protein